MAKPVTRRIRAERRARAEERQEVYDALSPEQKLVRKPGKRETARINRLLLKQEKESKKRNAKS